MKSQKRKQQTGEQRAEIALRENQELYTKLISITPDVIVVTDMEGKIIFINDMGVQISGYSSAEKLIGENLLRFIALESREKAGKNLARMLKWHLAPNEYGLITKGGRCVPFEVNGDVLRNSDGTPYARVHICRDISERKKTEEALIKSEQKYRALLDNAADAVLIAHKDGYIIDTNPKARELLGYSKKEFRELHFTKLYLPKDRQRAKEAFDRIIHQKRFRVSDAHVLKKDGQIIDADINGSCFKAGDDILVTGIFRDMTEQKQILNRLKTAQKDLEARIVERTMELMESNTALKVLLSYQENEKSENEEKLLMNLQAQVIPHIQELRKGPLNASQKAHIQLVEKNLQNVMSEFLMHLKSNVSKLTPKEIQVASLVKEGMGTREIARLLNVSTKTVDIFRYNIRKKMGLNNRRASLRTHLLSL